MTTQESNALVPAEDSRMSFGQTALRPQDFVPPRVKVVQQMSKEAADKVAEPGEFFNTLLSENMGPVIRIQPIQTFMQRILLVRREKRGPIEDALAVIGKELPEGDGLMCRSFDMIQGKGSPGILCEECPLSQWDEDTRKPPLCTETYNVAAMDEVGGLIVLSFQKSSAKVGKRFFSALRMRPGYPWNSIYEISTRAETNDQGHFFVPFFTVVKEPPSTDQLAGALEWAKQLRGVQIDVTPEDDDAPSPRGVAPTDDDEPPF